MADILKPLRDAAFETRHDRFDAGFMGWGNESDAYDDGFLAGARHALAHPIILRTPEELDALPEGSVVLDRGGTAFFKEVTGAWWNRPVYRFSEELIEQSGSVQLIELPRGEEAE
ncbi:hypothetical protein [Nesterenkonia suensis]